MQPLLAGEFVCPVRGADGHGQRVAAASFDKFGRLGRIGQAGAADYVFFHPAEQAQFGLDQNALVMGPVDDAAGNLDILLERLVRGVDHHRRIKSALDAVVADFFGAVVKMDGENGLRKYLFGRSDHRLQKTLIGKVSWRRGISG